MEAMLSPQRLAPAIAALAVGSAVSWLTQSPLGLLAPVAAVFLFARGRTVLLLHVASAIGLVGSLLIAAFYTGAMRELAVAWAAFFAVAPCIGAIVATSGSALPGAGAMPAAIRSTTRQETPSYPAMGPTPEEKVAPRNSPIVSIAVRDDKDTAERMVATSFWGGTPFHMRYWRHLPDGSYRWTEIRTEPLYEPGGTQQWSGVSADIDDQKPRPPQPTKTASNPPNDDDAIRAAKVVERLLGNAWAFDGAGRPTYLSPFSQIFVAMTLEEFQAAVDEGHAFFKGTCHPDEYDRIAAAWRHSLQTGDPFYIERRIRRATGIHDWSRTAIVPTRDHQGRITGWYGASIDLDAYRSAELALRDREGELSQLVDMVPSHIWRLTPDGEPVFFNKRMIDFLGRDVADTGKPGISRLDALIEAVHPGDAAAFRGVLNRCLVTGESFALRYRLRRADGVYRWLSSRAEPMRDQDGRILQWYGLCHDIDDQVHAEAALRDRERELSQLVETLPALIYCAAPDGEPGYRSRQLRDFLGFKTEDAASQLADILKNVIHPDDVATVKEKYAHSMRTGELYTMKHRVRRFDGEYRWVESRAAAMRNDDGAIVQWNGIYLDIDDEVRAQDALRQSERAARQIVETLPAMIYCTTADGEPSYHSRQFRDFVGFESEDASRRLADILNTVVHPDDVAAVVERYTHSMRTGEPYTMKHRVRRFDGEFRWVLSRAAPMRDDDAAVMQWNGIYHDIDDEVRAQEALLRSEQGLRQLIDAVPVNFYSLTPAGLTSYLSKRYQENLGLALADFEPLDDPRNCKKLQQAIFEKTHPDDMPEVRRRLSHSFETGETHQMRFRRRGKDGVYRWIEGRLEPQRDQGGKILQWCGVSLDIDDEVHAQEGLRDRERELSQLVNMVPVHIRRLTPEGEPAFFNKRLIDFLGVDLAELGKPGMSRLAAAIETLIHPDEAASLLETVRRSLAAGEGYAMKYRMRRADGMYRWMEGRSEPLRNQDGAIVQWYAISIDIDDEMRAQQTEEALRQASDKLAQATQAASLAELSASIAHEVNQPLAAIVANSHACDRWLSAAPPNVERAKITTRRIIRDANSAAEVVGRIRALFKQSMESRVRTAFDTVIAEARDLMAEEASRGGVRIDVELESGLPLVAIDPVQIQQVLVNLIRNGAEAMTASFADPRVLRVCARRLEDAVQTEISDHGRGVEFPDKIFEPFFTTKQHGMGMGLAICRSIVESHGGRLWVESNEPQGAKFIFTLPVEVKAAP